MSQQKRILDAVVEALKAIDGTGSYSTDLNNCVYLALKDVRLEADGASYIEVGVALPGTRRLAADLMESGLSDQAVMRVICYVTSMASTDGTDEDDATESARLLEEDIRRAMYANQQLPLSTATPAGDEQCYYLRWVESEPIGLFLDELGRILFTVQFDIIYAATAFL